MILGLTGGIGSGKSTVSSYICEKYGFLLVDADMVSRDLQKKGSPLLKKISEEFGSGYIREDGELDRKKLGSTVFSMEGGKKKLDSIMMPAILESIRKKLACGGKVLLDAALLFEEGLDGDVDVTILVDAPEEVRIKRVSARDNISLEDVRNRISNQMPSEEKRVRADYIIDNSGTQNELYEKVDNIMKVVL